MKSTIRLPRRRPRSQVAPMPAGPAVVAFTPPVPEQRYLVFGGVEYNVEADVFDSRDNLIPLSRGSHIQVTLRRRGATTETPAPNPTRPGA
jgi:hypothetical protein